MSPTPYRYAEKSVFRYLYVIGAIQDRATPQRLEFDPTSLGVNSETAACRLRDAVHSLCTGMTSHPSIDPTLLAERFRHYRVSHDGTKVFIIPKTEKKQTNDVGSLEVSQSQSGDILARVNSTDQDAIGAFALLLGRQLLQGKVEIIGELDDNLRSKLYQAHDIVIDSVSPNLHIMF